MPCKILKRAHQSFFQLVPQRARGAGLVAVALIALSSCSQKTAPSDSTPAQPAGQAPAAGQTPPPNYVAATARNAPAQNVAGQANAFLTDQLRIFIREKRRAPDSFAELARVRLDSVPRPPEGKKWVIDTATTEVKAVAAP